MENNQISKNEKMFAALSYVWVLCLIPVFFGRKFRASPRLDQGQRLSAKANEESAFVEFHARQGLVLLVCWLAVSLLSWVPLVGQLAVFLLFVISVVGIVKTMKGEEWEIPILGKYARQIKI